MNLTKRDFLKVGGAALASLPLAGMALAAGTAGSKTQTAATLQSITGDVKPISPAERMARIAKAQALMQKHDIAAMVLEPGAAMDYFCGIQWWRSERLTALVIPREGEIAVVCPFFEQPSIRESMAVGQDVRVWQEHESPFERIKQILADRKLNSGKLAFEHSVRYFVLEGVMQLLPQMQHLSADPVTLACRMHKSRHELELMHKASEITLSAYAHIWPRLAIGMTQGEVAQMMTEAQAALGGSASWTLILFDEASAYPHGTRQQHKIREGSTVLLDCGCAVEGYQSDISRTMVFGEASQYQRKIWDTVRKGQQIAFDKAQLGTPAGAVDDAVRAYYQQQGLGPDYTLPGLSHRTGHGIGMEGHERVNLVRGETQTLEVGMCFSNEPGIYIPGKFGVRLEDCIYMTEKGPQWFTQPPASLDSPIGELIKLV